MRFHRYDSFSRTVGYEEQAKRTVEVFRLTQGLHINKPQSRTAIHPLPRQTSASRRASLTGAGNLQSHLAVGSCSPSLFASLFRPNNRQLRQMEPRIPSGLVRLRIWNVKEQASADGKEEEPMPQGSRRRGRLPSVHGANSNTNRLPVQDKPTNRRPARWQVAAAWTRLYPGDRISMRRRQIGLDTGY